MEGIFSPYLSIRPTSFIHITDADIKSDQIKLLSRSGWVQDGTGKFIIHVSYIAWMDVKFYLCLRDYVLVYKSSSGMTQGKGDVAGIYL